MNLEELVESGTEVSITVSLLELVQFANCLIDKTRRDIEQAILEEKTEIYLSPQQVSQMLSVDVVTLWRWNNRGYLTTIEIGGKRRYRMSDIKAKLNSYRKK